MIVVWSGFLALILILLGLDLGVFHRRARRVSVREALGWSAGWIALGLSFALFVYFGYEHKWLGLGTAVDSVDGVLNDGVTAVEKYLTGYLVEKSLSVDNIFVIALIFNFFAVPGIYQHRVLFWGILGALLMRGGMIGVGARLIAEFHWILYLFALFLIVTGVRMLLFRAGHADLQRNAVLRLARRLFPVTARFHGEHFMVRAGAPASRESELPGGAPQDDEVVARARTGKWLLTPLALALVMVETTDLIFAVDSIPAIFAITADPFLVYTSNVFAILGLRSLYFALAGLMNKFRYLKAALAVVLLLVGLKLLLAGWLKSLLGRSFNLYLLLVVLLILATGVVASLLAEGRDRKRK